jgi:dienelactone hydrolase
MNRRLLFALLLVPMTACMSHRECVTADKDLLAKFQPFPYPADSRFKIFKAGTGPPLIVLHELPGLTLEDLRLADKLAADFTVYVPLFFDEPGANHMLNVLRISFWRDFAPLSRHHPGRVVEWVRALGKYVSDQPGGGKVSVIGMCMTGSFPIALAHEKWFGAGVMSQPALPLLSGAPGVSDDDIAKANAPIVYLRFYGDKLSPHRKIDSFRGVKNLTIREVKHVDDHCQTHSVLASGWKPGTPADDAYEFVRKFLMTNAGRR